MTAARTVDLSWVLPASVFDQVSQIMQQTAQTLGEAALVLTETALQLAQPVSGLPTSFVVVVSAQFSGLLAAEALPAIAPDAPSSTAAQPHLSPLPAAEPLYRVGLTFDPGAIAQFLSKCDRALQPKVLPSLKQAGLLVQPNDDAIQSEFTLRLITTIFSTRSSQAVATGDAGSEMGGQTNGDCDLPVAAAVSHQVEQERLLNQVITQIRHSTDLTEVLKTAVQQVQQFLQVDRVVIYEFETASGLVDGSIVDSSLGGGGAVAKAKRRSKKAIPTTSAHGRVTYEAIASPSLSSALHLSEEAYCFSELQDYREKYRKGCTLAVDDVSKTYALSPCLLNLLQRAGVTAKLLVPIVVESELWGLLIAHQCGVPRSWQESEKLLMQRIAEHLAIAIYQSRLYTQLQHQSQQLEQRVIERTQDLRDALITAQAASQAKTEFLAAMSHELRTPLTCVIGMAETLLRVLSQPPTKQSLRVPKQQEYLQIIKRSGEHLLELINDILDVSQVEAGKMALNLSQFSLSQLAHQSLQALSERARTGGVELALDLHPDLVNTGGNANRKDTFTADRRRLNQVLLNLLSNAIKFTPSGGRVVLRVVVTEAIATFQVQDTGIGIDESQRSLLFQKFQQLDSSYHRTYEGVGLGLALTQQLVELHGGAIEVESVLGSGSTFTVQIPAQSLPKATQALSEDGSSLALQRSGQPSAEDTAQAVGRRIVLIEDHDETAMLICDLLAAAGYQVIWMVEGATAMQQIEMLEPALVITGIYLPGINGYEVIRFLRHHPKLYRTKILAISKASAAEETCMAEGADAYLLKPINPYQLLDQITLLMVGA